MKKFLLKSNALQLIESPIPIPKVGEVLVNFKAWSLNYRDLLVVTGSYGKSVDNVVPFSDACGEVVEAPPGSLFKTGDRVIPVFMPDWQSGDFQMEYARSALGHLAPGVLAEYATFPEKALVIAPRGFDFTEGATLNCAGLTAYNALFGVGKISKNQRVLLLGTGGVSIFALQLAQVVGAEIFVISGTDEKLEKARKLGAQHLINYHQEPNWSKKIWELTAGQGVDLVVETGGATTLNQSLQSTRAGGTVAIIGTVSGRSAEIDLANIFRRQLKVQGIFVGSKSDFSKFNNFILQHSIRPIIDRVFSFNAAPEALAYLRSQKHFGKVVLRGEA